MIKQTKLHKPLGNLEDNELASLIVGRTGGKTTIRIIDALLMKPYNANQLATVLHLDYKTILYHINLIYGLKYVDKLTIGNTTIYHLSDKFYKSLDEYNIIKENI